MIADMDSTIIENECIDELADAIGVGDVVSDITERAMRGELEFESALRERVGLLKGLSESDLQQIFDDRIRLTPGAKELVAGLQERGITCILVSGGFTFFTGRVADMAGFSAHHANELDFRDGALTGNVVEPILGAQAKLDTLNDYVAQMLITTEQVIAIGDGANDIPMIKAAGLGVAFCPKPVTAEAADAVVNKRDLREVLNLLD